MRQVALADGVESSAIGFGCAPILGAVGPARARRAIHAALDAGVTHFDLARSYGYGQAESFVGGLLKEERSRLQIATKFGIRANWKSRLFRPLKPLYRTLKKSKPKPPISTAEPAASATDKNRLPDLFHSRLTINAANMEQSLNQSLRALRTDYVDYFMVHEPIEQIADIDALARGVQRLKESGKVRAFGVASLRWDDPLCGDYEGVFDFRQFARPAAEDIGRLVEQRCAEPNIMFAVHRNRDDSTSVSDLAKRLPRTVFLYSMFTPEHIVANAKCFS